MQLVYFLELKCFNCAFLCSHLLFVLLLLFSFLLKSVLCFVWCSFGTLSSIALSPFLWPFTLAKLAWWWQAMNAISVFQGLVLSVWNKLKSAVSLLTCRTLSSDGVSLSLPELQVGLCALDPATPHGATPGQVRCQLIFKYYNTSSSGVITYPEFRYM